LLIISIAASAAPHSFAIIGVLPACVFLPGW
jgi:hypothetical protein